MIGLAAVREVVGDLVLAVADVIGEGVQLALVLPAAAEDVQVLRPVVEDGLARGPAVDAEEDDAGPRQLGRAAGMARAALLWGWPSAAWPAAGTARSCRRTRAAAFRSRSPLPGPSRSNPAVSLPLVVSTLLSKRATLITHRNVTPTTRARDCPIGHVAREGRRVQRRMLAVMMCILTSAAVMWDGMRALAGRAAGEDSTAAASRFVLGRLGAKPSRPTMAPAAVLAAPGAISHGMRNGHDTQPWPECVTRTRAPWHTRTASAPGSPTSALHWKAPPERRASEHEDENGVAA